MILMFKYTNRRLSGHEFVRVDTEAKAFASGNTASTIWPQEADLATKVATKRELDNIKDRLMLVLDYADAGRK